MFTAFGCNGTNTKSAQINPYMQGLINRPLVFVDSEASTLWEGEINGMWVAYYRSRVRNTYKNVVVVTQDNMPNTFRRTEYCDSNGDNILDRVNINVYHSDNGWNTVTITDENELPLQHANKKYNRILDTIRRQRLKQINF